MQRRIFSPSLPRSWKPSGANLAHLFTPREKMILDGVLAGFSSKEIARSTGTTAMTIRNRMRPIYEKSGMGSRLELALFWLEHGFRR